METGKSKSKVKTNSVAQSDEDIKAADKGKILAVSMGMVVFHCFTFNFFNNHLFLWFIFAPSCPPFLVSSVPFVLECLGACFAYSCYCCTYCLMFCAGRDTDEAAD
jgi:hypothetical protein